MSQTFFEPEVAEQQRSKQPMDSVGETAAVALSADDFSALEERIVRAVELVKRERQARAAAEERAAKAEAQLAESRRRSSTVEAGNPHTAHRARPGSPACGTSAFPTRCTRTLR